jgi:hypothetical protein
MVHACRMRDHVFSFHFAEQRDRQRISARSRVRKRDATSNNAACYVAVKCEVSQEIASVVLKQSPISTPSDSRAVCGMPEAGSLAILYVIA